MHRLDFQKIVENAEEGIFLISTNGVIQYSNPAGEKMLGYEPGKLASIPLERVVSPDSLGQTLAMLERVGRSPGTPSHHEIKLLTKAGEIRSADAIASAVSTEGAVTWVQAIVRDTTEENALRNKLIEEKRRSERLIEDSESIIIGVDSGLRVNIFNSGATKLLGYSRSEVMGRDMLDLNILQGLPVERMRGAPPDSAKMIPRNVDGWVQTKNGDRLRIAWNVGQTFDGDGSVTGTIAFGTDITSKAALADLLERRNRLLTMQTEISFLAASASNPRVLMEGGLKLMASNFDFTRGAVSKVEPGGGLAEIGSVGPAPTDAEVVVHEKAVRLALATGEPLFLPEDAAGLGIDSILPERRSIVVLPLRGRSGIVGVMCMCSEEVAMDEERKNTLVSLASLYGFALENALLTENLNRAKDQLQLYNDMITHDVVNYAMPISSYVDLLSRKGLPEEKRQAYLGKMKDATRLLESFLRDARVLLKAADRREVGLRPVPVVDAMKRSIETCQGRYPKANISLEQDDGLEVPCAVSADDALPEVFTNLLTNAAKFSGTSPMTARIHVDKERDVVRIEVEDHGPGIPDDLKYKVFERRYSKGPPGSPPSTGLGLTIVKALVDNYGGKVWADDRVKGEWDKGAKLVVELRLAAT